MGRVFCCSDLHGCYDKYLKVKEFLEPDDTVYFLGDAGDRGPDPWKCIIAILDDEQFIYLLGNHEDMLIDALRGHSARLCFINGGEGTYMEASADPDLEKRLAQLEDLPLLISYENEKGQLILMSHAGFTPWGYGEDSFTIPEDSDLIWDRDHWLDTWPKTKSDDIYIIHGHTPTPNLAYSLVEPMPEAQVLWYAHGHKLDIDCGCVWTDIFALVDLNTWEVHYF